MLGLIITATIFTFLTPVLMLVIVWQFKKLEDERHKKLLNYMYENFKHIDPDTRPPSKNELKPEIKPFKGVSV
jgi:hypothetical protein